MANEQTNNKGSDEIKAQAGSPNDLGSDPSKTGVKGGESEGTKSPKTNEDGKSAEETVEKKQYEELESKLGIQGKELGEFRDFFKSISPLLDKLDQQPELVQAIIDGKIDGELAKSVLEGKVSIKEAEIVSEANKEVKEEVGEKKYKELDPSTIEKMVSDKAKEIVSGIEKKMKDGLGEIEDLRAFENGVTDFINSTKDFPEYAEGIKKWFDENPDQDNIKIAYNAVKGEVLAKKLEEEDDKNAGEAAKNVAADAGGGASQGSTVVKDKNVIDELIAGQSNPNVF